MFHRSSITAQHIPGLRGPLAVEQFKGGQSNPTYKVSDAAGRRFVLRRKPPGKLLPSAHAVDREFRVIHALYPTGFPSPSRMCCAKTRLSSARRSTSWISSLDVCCGISPFRNDED